MFFKILKLTLKFLLNSIFFILFNLFTLHILFLENKIEFKSFLFYLLEDPSYFQNNYSYFVN
jgi:hypothetical protein